MLSIQNLPSKIQVNYSVSDKEHLNKKDEEAEILVTSEHDKKQTDQETVHLSIEGLKKSKEADKAEDDNLPLPVKLLKEQLERLKNQLDEVKKELNDIKANRNIDDETKKQQLSLKQNEIAQIMTAIITTTEALLELSSPKK